MSTPAPTTTIVATETVHLTIPILVGHTHRVFPHGVLIQLLLQQRHSANFATSQPTTHGLIVDFRLSSDSEILLISADSAFESAPKRAKKKRVRDVYMFRLSFRFCMPPLVVGITFAVLEVNCVDKNKNRVGTAHFTTPVYLLVRCVLTRYSQAEATKSSSITSFRRGGEGKGREGDKKKKVHYKGHTHTHTGGERNRRKRELKRTAAAAVGIKKKHGGRRPWMEEGWIAASPLPSLLARVARPWRADASLPALNVLLDSKLQVTVIAHKARNIRHP